MRDVAPRRRAALGAERAASSSYRERRSTPRSPGPMELPVSRGPWPRMRRSARPVRGQAAAAPSIRSPSPRGRALWRALWNQCPGRRPRRECPRKRCPGRRPRKRRWPCGRVASKCGRGGGGAEPMRDSSALSNSASSALSASWVSIHVGLARRRAERSPASAAMHKPLCPLGEERRRGEHMHAKGRSSDAISVPLGRDEAPW